jgi:hypothetical protein
MNIVYNLLNELKYQTKEPFTFDISSDGDKTPIIVTPFVSVEYPCQTYLVIETENQALGKVNNDYLKALALAFRKVDFHESDMDKNTTLVITSARSNSEPLNSDAKVKIEDDPYYFKKYVFSYTSASERLATSFLEHKKTECTNEFSYVNEVLDYLMNAEEFGKYKDKDKKDELSTYSYFVELATKIPAFPLNIRNSEQIKSVSEFLSEQLDGKDVNTEHLDFLAFSGLDFNEASVESILAKYDEITTK